MTLVLHIRPLAHSEISILEQHFCAGGAAKHRERFERQVQGQVIYLIAWQAAYPLGHLLLKWAGSTDEPMASHLRQCPDIEDVFVGEQARSQGEGRRLLAEAEHLARQHDYMHAGLGMEINNVRARSLYERLGYLDAGLGVYRESGHFLDTDGQEHTWEEDCVYLIKSLLHIAPDQAAR